MLYHELRRRKNWKEVFHEIRKLPGGSSSLDMPVFVREERLKEILLSVPEAFSYFWRPELDAKKHVKLDKKQKKAWSKIYNAGGLPTDLYEISAVICRASGYSKRATKRFLK